MMPGQLLTTASTIMCPHGGQAVLTTADTRGFASSAAVLLENDMHTVAGCPFILPGGKPSPCVRVQWSAGAARAKINGTSVLIKTSIGNCYNAEGAPQGPATIINTQLKASAQ